MVSTSTRNKLEAFHAKRKVLGRKNIISFFVIAAVGVICHVVLNLLDIYNKTVDGYLAASMMGTWLIYGWWLEYKARCQSCPHCGEPCGIKLIWPRNLICKRCWHDLEMK
jgi:hypothetical protein